MNLTFVIIDALVVVLSIRSVMVLGRRAPFTSAGWLGALGYGAVAGYAYTGPGMSRGLMYIADAFFVILMVAFIIAAVRDEPQAEPWWWPARIGMTRAQKRAN